MCYHGSTNLHISLSETHVVMLKIVADPQNIGIYNILVTLSATLTEI